jgi:hypothetical protein
MVVLRRGGRARGDFFVSVTGNPPQPVRGRAGRCSVATSFLGARQSRHRVRAAHDRGRGATRRVLPSSPPAVCAPPEPRAPAPRSRPWAVARSRRCLGCGASTAPVRGWRKPAWSSSPGGRCAGRLFRLCDGKPAPTGACPRRPVLCCDSASDSEAKSQQSSRHASPPAETEQAVRSPFTGRRKRARRPSPRAESAPQQARFAATSCRIRANCPEIGPSGSPIPTVAA